MLRLFLRYSLKPLVDNPGRTLANSSIMFVQDLLLFASWIVLFRAVGPIRSWDLHQIYLLYGLLYAGMGLGLFFTEGIRQISHKIATGDLDLFLTRPVPVLPQLFMEKASPANIGDMLCGLLFLCGPAHLSAPQLGLALVAVLLIGLLVTAIFLLYQSVTFFIRGGPTLAEYLFDGVWYFSLTPQEGQGWLVKLLLFTLLPAGFINIFSVALVERTHLFWLGGLALIVAVYAALAVGLFNAGVQRYVKAQS